MTVTYQDENWIDEDYTEPYAYSEEDACAALKETYRIQSRNGTPICYEHVTETLDFLDHPSLKVRKSAVATLVYADAYKGEITRALELRVGGEQDEELQSLMRNVIAILNWDFGV